MRKIFLALMTVLLAAFLLAGCSGSSPTSGPGQSQPEASVPDPSEKSPGTSGMSDRLSTLYVDMLTQGKYYMKYRAVTEIQGEKMDMTAEVAIQGDDMAMRSNSNVAGSENVMIIKGGKMYIVDHESKIVMVMPAGPDMGKQSGALPDEGLVFKGTGTADFFGVSRNYEEYGVESGSVRFFFDGSKLVGIENSSEGLTMQMEILEWSDKVPSGMFDLPSDYSIIEN